MRLELRRSWSDGTTHLLFDPVDLLDVLACPRCGGRLTLIDDPAVIGRMLQHLELPTEVPEARPARAPPALLLDGAPRSDAPRRVLRQRPRLTPLSAPSAHPKYASITARPGLDLGLTSGQSRHDVFSQAVILP